MKKQASTELIQLLTPWGEKVEEQPWNVYPRPQLRRDSFLCLNGKWTLWAEGVTEGEEILVPFPPESILSGIGRHMGDAPRLRYERRFVLPADFIKTRVLLHFGGVDQIARVFLNGKSLGTHAGGYDAFSFDVTDALTDGENLLLVEVEDDLDSHVLPWGKQKNRRGGMWYTPVSGIWQTVWMESVPAEYIQSLRIKADTEAVEIRVEGVREGRILVTNPDGIKEYSLVDGRARIAPQAPRLWSPEDPYLYEFEILTREDHIRSYFALRSVDVREINGIPRICLNGKPYFFHGLLDQGYYSDGIYTPASPACYEFDICSMKELGFNTLRKHIKVEPEQFYYDCDRLGMIVFQDLVNNGDYSFLRDTALPTVGIQRLNDKRMHRDPATRAAFLEGMERTVAQLFNHPCILYWTIFNEGWGQFDGETAYHKMKKLDNSRVIDTVSGWFAGASSDVESLHVYFKPVKLKKGCIRPLVLSEFGGYSYKPEGHVFNPKNTYGYRFFKDRKAFEDALVTLYETEIIPARERGLCASIYTQVSDVEDETNGLLSYDRRVCKVDGERMRTIARALSFEQNDSQDEQQV